MRIALVSETYLPFIAGVSTSTDSIARFMAEHGHTVFLICPKPILTQPEPHYQGIHIVHTPSIPDPTYSGKPMTPTPFGFMPIYRTLTSRHIDLVHIQEPGSLGISALIAAKMTKTPVIGALHFTPEQISRMVWWLPGGFLIRASELYIRFVYNRYNAIMVPTKTFAAFLSRIGVKKSVHVVSNGVDTTLYTSDSQKKSVTRKTLGIHMSACVFLFLGRLDKDKNVQAIICALPSTHANVHVVIAGTGKEETALKNLAEQLGVAKKITWLAQINQQEMLDLYRCVDCFIIMALYEVQSIVTLQALACELPVIAARAGALPELVIDGKNGYLVPPQDDVLLGQKINMIATDSTLRKTMGAHSRIISLTHHKPTALARLESLYRDTITGEI